MADTATILAAVDNLIDVHNRWEADPNAPLVPTVAFEAAINRCYQDCEGDVPGQCREVVTAVGRLVVEWNRYATDTEARDRQNRPLPMFWAAFRAMVDARANARIVGYKRPELVKELRAQKVSDRQIANKIYVDNSGKGPLQDEHGHPDPIKLDEEAATPGKHTTDWLAEQDRLFVEAQMRAADYHLQHAPVTLHGLIPSGVEVAPKAAPELDKSSVLEHLQQGAFVEQVARTHGVTVEQVLQVCAENNIEPVRRPSMLELKSFNPTDSDGPAATASPAPKPAVSKADADGVDIDALIIAEFEAGKSGPEVAESLAPYQVSVQKANAVWRFHRQRIAKQPTATAPKVEEPAAV